MAAGLRDLVLIVSSVDYSDSVSRALIRSEDTDSDFVSFDEAMSGGKRDYILDMELFQDLAVGSLWDVVWTQRAADVPFELWLYGRPGGGVPTTAQPKIAGVATVADPDGDLAGGEPDEDPTVRPTIAVEWLCTGKPARTTS